MSRWIACALVACPLLVLLARPSSAQESVQFAPTLGANIATIASDTASNTAQKVSLMGGVEVTVPGPGPFALQSGLLVSPKGTNVTNEEGGEVQFSAVYAELPVHVRAELPSVRTVTPHILAGGYGSIKVFEQQSFGGRGQLPVDLDESFYRRFDAGISGAVGASLGLSDNRLGLTVRYSYGLVEVVENVDTPPFPDNPEQRPPGDGNNSVWTFSVSFGL
jgi:hypothetical protein